MASALADDPDLRDELAEVHARQVVRRIYEEGLNRGQLDVVGELVDHDFVNHAAPADAPAGPDGAKATFRMIRESAPDYHLATHHVVAEDDLVVVHGTGSTGPMDGEFQGVDVTG